MEIKARKIGNSIGIIFSKDIAPEVGEPFSISKVENTYILRPKKVNIFESVEDWAGFRSSVTSEDIEWDSPIIDGKEN